ncbi:MAG: hypothetical protein ACRDN0_18790, partial [Trebonia sp.]
MNERRFRPELRVLAAIAVAVVLAVWFTRSRSPSVTPAGSGPGIEVNFTAARHASGAGAVIGVDAAMPPSLPGAAVREAFAKLGLGMPALQVPDNVSGAVIAADTARAVRHASGQPPLLVITATSAESAATYAERFGLLYTAAKDAGPGVRVGGFIGGYNGSFLDAFLKDGGSRADFVDFGFYGENPARPLSDGALLGELGAVSGEIGDARSVIAASVPARAGDIGVYVGPWNITSGPASLRYTSFAAMWDAALLGRILTAGDHRAGDHPASGSLASGSLADGSGLLYDGDGTAPRAYQPGDPTPLYAAIAMFTGSGLFPGFGTVIPGTVPGAAPGTAAVGVTSALPGVEAFASTSPDEIVVVNTSGSDRSTVLHVGGDTPMRAAQWRLGESAGAVSGPVSAGPVSAGTATSQNGSFALSLPPGSVTTVVVTPAAATGGSRGTVTGGSRGTVAIGNASTGQCLASAASGTVATASCSTGTG